MNQSLHRQLLEAHARSDAQALAALYGQAAAQAENNGLIDEACFLLTQAYVFALEAGSSDASLYNKKLAHYGRDVLRKDLPGATQP